MLNAFAFCQLEKHKGLQISLNTTLEYQVTGVSAWSIERRASQEKRPETTWTYSNQI